MVSAIDTINRHYQAIIEKNIEGICSKYYPSEDTYVILEGPRLATKGFEKIKKGWKDFCDSNLKLESIDWIEGPFAEEKETMAWVAGIIQLNVSVKEKKFQNTFRMTFVLVTEDGNWKIKHEHASLVHPDPYGMGDWLKDKV
jgi:ketosteroid isomerase-like protein